MNNMQAAHKWNFLIEKRIEVLNAIKPYCDLFGIEEYDYIVKTDIGVEILKLNNTRIGCTSNSITAVIDEVIGYIFVNRYCKNRSIGHFSTQTINAITKYWLKEGAIK